jgi:hypothetical protein
MDSSFDPSPAAAGRMPADGTTFAPSVEVRTSRSRAADFVALTKAQAKRARYHYSQVLKQVR